MADIDCASQVSDATAPELAGKTIILGISGSISAYKSCTLASLLVKAGAVVHPVLTRNGSRFITTETMAALCGNPALIDEFEQPVPGEMAHIALASRADAFIVAPASADLIARMACGMANDMLTLLFTVTRAPVVIAPAMNTNMWTHPLVQANVRRLQDVGCTLVEPASGRLACGTVGAGKLAEPEDIFVAIRQLLRRRQDLAGTRILITAGPTREPLDAVRFLSNRSSGKMGYALARSAQERGAVVTLVSGPTALDAPTGVHVALVGTAAEMRQAVLTHIGEADVAIGAAAIADFTVEVLSTAKLDRQQGPIQIELVPTVDIMEEIGRHKGARYHVGFAAETGDPCIRAQQKLVKKNLDMIVANDVTAHGAGFDTETNLVTLILANGATEALPLLPKLEVANRILDRVVEGLRPLPGQR